MLSQECKCLYNCQGNVKFDFSCHFSCVATNVGDEGGFAPNIQDNKEGKISLMNKSLIFHQWLLALQEKENSFYIHKTCFYSISGLDLLKISIEKAGYTGKIEIGMDVAASGTLDLLNYQLSLII